MQRITGPAAACVALALFAASCGGGSASDTEDASPDFVEQGAQVAELDQIPEEAPAEDTGDGTGGAAESDEPGSPVPEFDISESDLPTDEEEDPDSEFFSAVGDFTACLTTEGYGFLGIPSEDLPEDDPLNDPGYIDALRGCAASSQIVSKMEAAEDTSSFTAEEIEEQNRNFALFVDCLIGRGWTIPTLTPDENGALQPPYVELAQSWLTPEGTRLLDQGTTNVDDFGDCGFNAAQLN